MLCVSIEIVGELQLRKYGRFLDEYATNLRQIEDAVQQSMCDYWDLTLDPISLEVRYLYYAYTIYCFNYLYLLLYIN